MTRFFCVRPDTATRNPALLRTALAVALAIVAAAAGGEPQTASYEAAIGAELEILTRDPDLELVGPEDVIDIESPASGPGVSFTPFADTGIFPIFQTMVAAAKVEGSASSPGGGEFVSANGYAAAGAFVQLVNFSEEPLEVELEVTLPGRSPDLMGNNEFFFKAENDESLSEFAAVLQQIEVVGASVFGTLPVKVFDARNETRDPLGTGVTPGPAQIDAFGVPFSQRIDITVPPSIEEIVEGGEVEIRINRFSLGLIARAAGEAGSVFDASPPPEPIVFAGDPAFDPERPLRPPLGTERIPALTGAGLLLLAFLLAGSGALYVRRAKRG